MLYQDPPRKPRSDFSKWASLTCTRLIEGIRSDLFLFFVPSPKSKKQDTNRSDQLPHSRNRVTISGVFFKKSCPSELYLYFLKYFGKRLSAARRIIRRIIKKVTAIFMGNFLTLQHQQRQSQQSI